MERGTNEESLSRTRYHIFRMRASVHYNIIYEKIGAKYVRREKRLYTYIFINQRLDNLAETDVADEKQKSTAVGCVKNNNFVSRVHPP